MAIAPGALDTFKFKHTPEDADALAAEIIPENFATGLADANWKTRLATLDEMTSWVEGAVGDLDSEVVVRFLGKKGWSEKNFQVRNSRRTNTSATHVFHMRRSLRRFMVYSASSPRNALLSAGRRLLFVSLISARSWEI